MMNHILIVICIMFVSLSALANESAAKVIKSTGTVTAAGADCVPRALSRGSDIFKSDTVTTAARAFATLRFSDGTVLDIAENSSLKIQEYHFDSEKPNEDSFKSEIIQGGFRAITGSIGSRNPSEFSTKARLTTLTVRGTGFAAGVSGEPLACGIALPEKALNDPVSISVIQGSIDVIADNQTIPLDAGSPRQSVEVVKGKVRVSKDILDFPQRGIIFQTSMKEFVKEAETLPLYSSQPLDPGAQTEGGAAGGGGDSSPCGTLNAVTKSLPPSANP